jgi:small subunit ribosomal protein S20
MANHKSSIKRIRQNEKRRAVNRANGSRMRTEIKKLRTALALGDVAGAKELLPAVMSVIDKSIQKGVVHRNAAAMPMWGSRLSCVQCRLGLYACRSSVQIELWRLIRR